MSESDQPYVLYGSYASYATAKTRSYLRKKGIPFVERVPGVPRFREVVRPATQNHRIPQLETPDGLFVQDTTEIFDLLEARFPEPAAYPPGACQQTVARLFEVLLDGVLGRPAWHYRWNYMDANYGFVGREFGRSFRPRGSNEELDKYGRKIADRMEGKRAGIGGGEALTRVLEEIYVDVLEILEAHFIDHPYLFGGMPSIADHVLMGSLFGHLARDPVPSMIMKQKAPRVFRWTEHMNTPEIVMPELPDAPIAYLPNDEIAPGILKLLEIGLSDVGPTLVDGAAVYNAWVQGQADRPAGSWVDPGGIDEAVVGRVNATLRGVEVPAGASSYTLWVLQRGLDGVAGLSSDDRAKVDELMAKRGGAEVLGIELARPLMRADSKMALGEART